MLTLCARIFPKLMLLFCLFFRHWIKVNVNCWFCNQSRRIAFSQRNTWTCDGCEQYNGFDRDGSYNKVIHEQFAAHDKTFYCKRVPITRYERHRLCDLCNHKQELKVKLLSDFVPLDEKNFEQELADFQRQFDIDYDLCSDCKYLLSTIVESRPFSFLDYFHSKFHTNEDKLDNIVINQPNHRWPQLFQSLQVVFSGLQLSMIILVLLQFSSWTVEIVEDEMPTLDCSCALL